MLKKIATKQNLLTILTKIANLQLMRTMIEQKLLRRLMIKTANAQQVKQPQEKKNPA